MGERLALVQLGRLSVEPTLYDGEVCRSGLAAAEHVRRPDNLRARFQDAERLLCERDGMFAAVFAPRRREGPLALCEVKLAPLYSCHFVPTRAGEHQNANNGAVR